MLNTIKTPVTLDNTTGAEYQGQVYQDATETNAAVTEAYTVDITKGATNGKVSSQWANRPDDEKFLTLAELRKSVAQRTSESASEVKSLANVKVNHANGLTLELDGTTETEMTNWSFSQLCNITKTPASYLSKLPAKLAAINLQYGLMNTDESKLAYIQDTGSTNTKLRAMTSESYGRIYDSEVVDQVMNIAGDGSIWKVPGMLDWSSAKSGLVKYNPFVDVTKETTTLYASDRDVFIFLVDDTHPIEVGKLSNGEPDLMFRGFYVWNSEVGNKTFGMSTMLLRGVCCNRNLWGVEGSKELRIRHSKFGPARFAQQAAPMLTNYANMNSMGIIAKVANAKSAIVAKNAEERLSFGMDKAGLTKSVTERVLDAVLNEEQHEAENVWDFVQGITAVARSIQTQDTRLAMEAIAGKLMDKVA